MRHNYYCDGRPYGGNSPFIHPSPFPPLTAIGVLLPARGVDAAPFLAGVCERLVVCTFALVDARGGVGETAGFEVRRLPVAFAVPVTCIGMGIPGRTFSRRELKLLTRPCCGVFCLVSVSCNGPLGMIGEVRDDIPGPGMPVERLLILDMHLDSALTSRWRKFRLTCLSRFPWVL